MREIKFRARSRENQCWEYSDQIGLYDFFYGVDDGVLDSETLGEFTGLKDKNDKEIYEGDILKMLSRNLSQVYFKEGGFCVDVGGLIIGFHPDYLGRYRTIEVIGNIYENPELLKND